jgi:hypothetical protein
MTADIFGLALLLVMLAAPVLIDRYVRHLPVAPACPTCACVARQAQVGPRLMAWIPAFGRTFLAECGRCGWRGRMRWKLATDSARHRH